MKKEPSESFVQIVVSDEGVRRACANFIVAIVGAFSGKRGVVATDED